MPPQTNKFQRLVAALMSAFHGPEYEVVEPAQVKDHKTASQREIDIFVYRHTRPGEEPEKYLMVECRDRRRAADEEWIDDLVGKRARLGFKRVIAVSSSGFSRNAGAGAIAEGIEPIHLKAAEERDWRQWQGALSTLGVREALAPKVVGVEIELSEMDRQRWPQEVRKGQVTIVGIDGARDTLENLVSAIQTNPKGETDFPPPDEPNATSHYTLTIPCDPGVVVFPIEGQPGFPVRAVRFRVERTCLGEEIGLDHYRLMGKQYQSGTSVSGGRETRLVWETTDTGISLTWRSSPVPSPLRESTV